MGQSYHPKDSLRAYPVGTENLEEEWCYSKNSTNCNLRYLRNPDECREYLSQDGQYTLKVCQNYGHDKDPQWYTGFGSLVAHLGLFWAKVVYDIGVGR